MDILKTLKEEQKEYHLTLLEDIQDRDGGSVTMIPGKSSPAAETLFPTSYPRDAKKIILKRIPTTSMEEFLMRLQLIQNMQAQQEAEQQEQQPDEEQVAANEEFLNSVLTFLSEKKVFNMFGPKTMNTLAALSVAGGIGLGGKAFEKSIDSKDNPTSSKVSLSKAPEKQTLKINDLKKSTEKPVEAKEEKPTNVVGDLLVPHLKEMEGWRARRYKDSKGLPTVGHGALIDGSFVGTMEKVFPHQSKEWRQKVAAGNMELTAAQGHELLTHQARQKHDQVRDIIGHETFDSMHPNLRMHIASEHFRGMIKKSPKALALIRKGDLKGASKEYLNADDYRENTENSIGKRMKNLSDALAKYSEGVKIPQTTEK
jgi:GH24 family phage-related lysozyme (muramidase)